MAITQKQVDDWFKANPDATPEQVAQTVQQLGGLSANEGLADLLGQHYGRSGENIGSIYDTLTYQNPGNEYKQNEPTPITSIEQMQGNTAQWNALEDYVKKNKEGIPTDPFKDSYVSISRQLGVDPELAKRFQNQYSWANSSQVRDAFSNPTTQTADVVYKLKEQGVSPEAIAQYTGIDPDRANQIYTNTTNDTQNFARAVKTGGMNITADTKYQRVPGGFIVTEPNGAQIMYDLMGKQIGRYDAPPPKGIAALAAKNPYLTALLKKITPTGRG